MSGKGLLAGLRIRLRLLASVALAIFALPADSFTRGYEDGDAEKGDPQFWRCEGCPARRDCEYIEEFIGKPNLYCPSGPRVQYKVKVRLKAPGSG